MFARPRGSLSPHPLDRPTDPRFRIETTFTTAERVYTLSIARVYRVFDARVQPPPPPFRLFTRSLGGTGDTRRPETSRASLGRLEIVHLHNLRGGDALEDKLRDAIARANFEIGLRVVEEDHADVTAVS